METVAEIIGDEPRVEAVERIEPPRHPHQPPFPAPGIYFGMPEEVYHSIHACSASGIKNLSVSSMDYWAMSLLNLERQEKPAKDSGDLTPRQLGQAYHCYIVEGDAVFNERYAVALDKDAWREVATQNGKELCVTIADIRAAIDAAGGKPKGTSKDALIDQLLDLDADAFVWDRMVASHLDANKDKTMITPKLYRRIVIANAMITNDPQLKDAFSGGHAEVSIFWYDEQTGVPMKARLDYLKMNHLIDLKSFSNMQGKPIQRAIDMAISNNKYFIPVVVYLEAIAAAKELVKQTKADCIYGWISGATPNAVKLHQRHTLSEWCWQWAHQPEPAVLFVFQQTGVAPVTRGRIMPTSTSYVVTQGAVQFLKRKWGRCAKTYGVDPWVDFQPVVQTEDESLTWAATDFGDYQ